MKTYTVTCQWMVSADVSVEANSLEEAMEKVKNDLNLPSGEEYLDGSFEVNEEVTREMNQ